MYTAFPISLRSGQVGVLSFTEAEGSALGAIEGAIFESDPDAPDAPLPPPTPCVVQGNVLYIPPLPVGMHLFEVRVDGGTVVYQHIEVQPSPLGEAPGSATWEVVVTRVGGEWHFTISTPAGPAGAPGKSAYDIWLSAGNVGSEADFLASLQGPAGRDGEAPSVDKIVTALLPKLAAEVALEGPTASYNGQCNYFQLGAVYLTDGLVLTQLGYRVRFDTVEGCAAGPVYLGVWERSADGAEWVKLGVSLDTQEHAGTLDMLWTFELGAVRLSGRPIRCCLLSSREDDWREDLLMGLRTAGTSDADTRLWYNETAWASVPKFFIRGYKTAPSIFAGGDSEGGGGGSAESGGVDEAAVRAIAAEEVEKALYDSVPGEIVLAAEASDNINCVSLELDPIHTPTARVSTIRLLARASGAVSGQTVYLSAWEQVSGEEYKLLAVSTNTQVQVAGQWSVWEFANLRLSGKRMRYAALATPSTPFAQASTLYMRCAPRPEGDSSLIHTSSSPFTYIPAMVIVTATGDAVFAPATHPQDSTAHLTAAEHTALTKLLLNPPSSTGGNVSGGCSCDSSGSTGSTGSYEVNWPIREDLSPFTSMSDMLVITNLATRGVRGICTEIRLPLTEETNGSTPDRIRVLERVTYFNPWLEENSKYATFGTFYDVTAQVDGDTLRLIPDKPIDLSRSDIVLIICCSMGHWFFKCYLDHMRPDMTRDSWGSNANPCRAAATFVMQATAALDFDEQSAVAISAKALAPVLHGLAPTRRNLLNNHFDPKKTIMYDRSINYIRLNIRDINTDYAIRGIRFPLCKDYNGDYYGGELENNVEVSISGYTAPEVWHDSLFNWNYNQNFSSRKASSEDSFFYIFNRPLIIPPLVEFIDIFISYAFRMPYQRGGNMLVGAAGGYDSMYDAALDIELLADDDIGDTDYSDSCVRRAVLLNINEEFRLRKLLEIGL